MMVALRIALVLIASVLLGPSENAESHAQKRKETKIRFCPTRAQQKYSRVRGARERRSNDIRALFAGAGLDYPARHVLIRVFKREDLVELWVSPGRKHRFKHIKDYDVCARSGALGPKRQRGDLQVPEGFYHISRFNPVSNFLLSMKVNYPNRSDRIRGHKKPGGDIFIHGSCVTIGCVPITDRWIEELYLICLDSHFRYGNNTQVHIFPTRLDENGFKWLEGDYSDRPSLLEYWRELEPGFTIFEQTHMPARFWIDKRGAYRFPKKSQPQPPSTP